MSIEKWSISAYLQLNKESIKAPIDNHTPIVGFISAQNIALFTEVKCSFTNTKRKF